MPGTGHTATLVPEGDPPHPKPRTGHRAGLSACSLRDTGALVVADPTLGRDGEKPLEVLDLDIEGLDAVGDLPRGHA